MSLRPPVAEIRPETPLSTSDTPDSHAHSDTSDAVTPQRRTIHPRQSPRRDRNGELYPTVPSAPPSPSPLPRTPSLRNIRLPDTPTPRTSATLLGVTTPQRRPIQRPPAPRRDGVGVGSPTMLTASASLPALPRAPSTPSRALHLSTSLPPPLPPRPPSTPTTRYKCPVCPHSSTGYAILVSHLRRAHADGPPPGLPLGTAATWCNGTWYAGSSLRLHADAGCTACLDIVGPPPPRPSPSPVRPRQTRSKTTTGSALNNAVNAVAGAARVSTNAPRAPPTNARTDAETNDNADADASGAATTMATPRPRCGDGLSASDLHRYPTRQRLPYNGGVHKAYKRCLKRLAEGVTAGSDADLRSLVLIPKLVIGAYAPLGHRALVDALDKYPFIPTPSPPGRSNATTGTYSKPSLRVRRLVAQGRLGAGARALKATAIAPRGAATDAALRALHPDGPADPFAPGGPRHPAKAVTEDALLDALGSFDKGTCAGADGWSVPLLHGALLDLPELRRALITLAGRVLRGTAPCRDILCASTLTPLQKYDADGNAVAGKVRPIAVGSLLYRLVMKTILRSAPLGPRALEKFQFGVGSEGGVEPIVQWLQNAVDDPGDLRTATFLDFNNAFNSVDRAAIADAVRSRAPHLYKAASWAYNAPSPLLTHSHSETVADDVSDDPYDQSHSAEPSGFSEFRSAQGVRQGDPLGPALFSLGVADLLSDLANALGPAFFIIAYLDDVIILGPGSALDKVSDFLEARGNPLTLNRSKSAVRPLSDIRLNGVDVLGTHVGPLATRRQFLSAAIDAEDDALAALADLRSQDALLLLRTCLQHNLAHLLRTLDSEGLGDLWQRRDRQLRTALSAIRGGPPDSVRDLLCATEYDDDLCALPVRLGGLGLLDHVERAPLARAAATDAARVVLADRFGADGDAPLSRGLSQHSRHAPVIDARLAALWTRLGPDERVALLENASPLGRRWLTTIPWSRDLTISDEAVSAALFARALARPRTPAPGHQTPCTLCNAVRPTIGHMDTCSSRNAARTRVHETLKRVIARALDVGMPCSETTLEPMIGNSALRNDIRLAAAPGCPMTTTEYDISTVALTSDMNHRPAVRHADVSDTRGDVLGAIDFALGFRAQEKYDKQRQGGVGVGLGAPHFVPVVISAGGVTYNATESGAMDVWRRHLPQWDFQNLLNAVSCALLARRTYLVPRRLRDLGDGGGNGRL